MLCFLGIAGAAGAQTCNVTFEGPYAKIYNEGGRTTHRLVHLGNNKPLAGFDSRFTEEDDELVYARIYDNAGKDLNVSRFKGGDKKVSGSAMFVKEGNHDRYCDFNNRFTNKTALEHWQ